MTCSTLIDCKARCVLLLSKTVLRQTEVGKYAGAQQGCRRCHSKGCSDPRPTGTITGTRCCASLDGPCCLQALSPHPYIPN